MTQPGEDLVELRRRDRCADPPRHPRPVTAAPLDRDRAPSVVVSMRPPGPASAIQRERVHNRAGTRVAGESRRNCAAPSRCAPAPTAHTAGQATAGHPRRAGPACRHLQPPAKVPGLGPRRPVPRHADGPQEPEPAQQIHAIRTQRRRRTASCLQVAEVPESPRPPARPPGPPAGTDPPGCPPPAATRPREPPASPGPAAPSRLRSRPLTLSPHAPAGRLNWKTRRGVQSTGPVRLGPLLGAGAADRYPGRGAHR